MKKPVMQPHEDETERILESLALVYSPAEERFDRITRLSRRLFAVRTAVIAIADGERRWFKASSALIGAALDAEEAFCEEVMGKDETFIVNDTGKHAVVSRHPAVKDTPHIRFCAGHPLSVDGRRIGLLCVLDDEPRIFSADDAESLRNLAALAEEECATFGTGEADSLLDESEQEQRELLIDAATGCWNGEALQYMLPREIALSNRSRNQFSYLHLELVPDPRKFAGISGQEVADVMREAALRVKRSLRPYDLVARIGPARFAVFAPSCSADVSELLADRIRARVSGAPFQLRSGTHPIDAKFGIVAAGRGNDDLTPARLTEVANMALQDALTSRAAHVRLLI